MIQEFETSEFMSTIIIERAKKVQPGKKGQLSFRRLFDISNRVMKDNPQIRISISSRSIESFCASMKIECNQRKIEVNPINGMFEEKLCQYKPIDENIDHQGDSSWPRPPALRSGLGGRERKGSRSSISAPRASLTSSAVSKGGPCRPFPSLHGQRAHKPDRA